MLGSFLGFFFPHMGPDPDKYRDPYIYIYIFIQKSVYMQKNSIVEIIYDKKIELLKSLCFKLQI